MEYLLNDIEEQLVDYLEMRSRRRIDEATIEEVRLGFNLGSEATTVDLLNSLVDKRVIAWQEGYHSARRLRITKSSVPDSPPPTVSVPLLALGFCSFGQDPQDGFGPESYLELTRDLVPDERGVYALRAHGDSMKDAMINEGDIVVIRQQQEIQNGDLAQVWLRNEGSATVKRIFRKNGSVCLKPENENLEARYYDASDVKIQGKVIMVIRQLDSRLAA